MHLLLYFTGAWSDPNWTAMATREIVEHVGVLYNSQLRQRQLGYLSSKASELLYYARQTAHERMFGQAFVKAP